MSFWTKTLKPTRQLTLHMPERRPPWLELFNKPLAEIFPALHRHPTRPAQWAQWAHERRSGRAAAAIWTYLTSLAGKGRDKLETSEPTKCDCSVVWLRFCAAEMVRGFPPTSGAAPGQVGGCCWGPWGVEKRENLYPSHKSTFSPNVLSGPRSFFSLIGMTARNWLGSRQNGATLFASAY